MSSSSKLLTAALTGAIAGAALVRAADAAAEPHAFLVAEIEVHDTAAYRPYAQGAAKAVAKYGGQYLARGGVTKAIEGEAPPNRVALLEFPNMSTLLRFEESPEYGAVRPIRQRSAASRIFAVEGVSAKP